MTKMDKGMGPHAAKRLARLAAVQALYRESYEQETLEAIARHMVDGGFAEVLDEDETSGVKPDAALFRDIVFGVMRHRDEIDTMLAGALDAKLSAGRMEVLLRSILRAGVHELWQNAAAPKGAVISDYVDVAKAYFQAKEPSLVNAVLDRVGSKLREG